MTTIAKKPIISNSAISSTIFNGQEIINLKDFSSKEDVTAYQFPALVDRLQKKLSLSKNDAEHLFKDMLMFLFLTGTNKSNIKYSPSDIIDEAWHMFLIFTREYAEFCQKYFGYFIHHRPFTNENEKVSPKNVKVLLARAKNEFGLLSKNWKYSSATCGSGGGCD